MRRLFFNRSMLVFRFPFDVHRTMAPSDEGAVTAIAVTGGEIW